MNMKKFAMALSLLLVCLQAAAIDLTPAQKKAQRSVYDYLESKNYVPSVDVSDESVTFRIGGVLYWIAFSGENPMLYSFHRNGYKIGDDDNKRDPELARIAANAVNLKHKAVKVVLTDKKADFVIEAYAQTTEHFNAVLESYLKLFDQVDTDFEKAYEDARKAAAEKQRRAQEEQLLNRAPSPMHSFVDGLSFQTLDANKQVITAYDQNLFSSRTRYVQIRVNFKNYPEAAKDCNFQVRITRPNGTAIVEKGSLFTLESTKKLEKTKKPFSFEFTPFGSEKDGFWKAGEYKVELYEGGQPLYSKTLILL
ncbi:MAG: hypothetical protein ACI3YD_03705 [Alloprevotella sp.]